VSNESRIDDIVEVLIALAQQDFSARARISERRDEVDAIAAGINMLAEELGGEVASRRELEAAYASLKDMQAQLVVAEKFAAIGQLASGVAHELNNPASWILLGLEHGRRRIAEARAASFADHARLTTILGELETILGDAQAGMERIKVVVGDLRTLSRAEQDEVTELDLNDVVHQSCKLARPVYQSSARIVLQLAALPSIRGSATRLGQLVTNLIVNASQAIAARGSDNEIVIATRAEENHVILTVEDTGPGIPTELRERVFEPYFTTKPAEIGTGLGLALVRKIASAHGGEARVTQGARSGACIEVRFPISHEPAPAAVKVRPSRDATPVQRGRLLVIDDEPMLLRAISGALHEAHDVVVARGGNEGLGILEGDRAFDLIVCDLQMPGFDGVAVFEAVAQRMPAQLESLVFMTGGAVTPRVQAFLGRRELRVLDKPIDLDALSRLARAAVEKRKAG
jgi:signal transduction histidine kinase/ActR/RegA family two-component response regulator